MDKEKILEMSRKENNSKDLVDQGAEKSASVVAGIAMIILSCIFYAMEIATRGKCNWGFFAIIALYNGVMYMIKGIKKKNWKECVAGTVWLVLAVMLSIEHINYLAILP